MSLILIIVIGLLILSVTIGLAWGVSLVIAVPATLYGGYALEACVPAWHGLGVIVESHLTGIALISVAIVIISMFISRVTMFISMSFLLVSGTVALMAYFKAFEAMNYSIWSFVLAFAVGIGICLFIMIKNELYEFTLARDNFVANVISVIPAGFILCYGIFALSTLIISLREEYEFDAAHMPPNIMAVWKNAHIISLVFMILGVGIPILIEVLQRSRAKNDVTAPLETAVTNNETVLDKVKEEEKIAEEHKENKENNRSENIQKMKEYKELLDSGIITEEDFLKKKKELLDL